MITLYYNCQTIFLYCNFLEKMVCFLCYMPSSLSAIFVLGAKWSWLPDTSSLLRLCRGSSREEQAGFFVPVPLARRQSGECSLLIYTFQIRNGAPHSHPMCADSPVGDEHHNKPVSPYPCHEQGGNQVEHKSKDCHLTSSKMDIGAPYICGLPPLTHSYHNTD